MSHIIKVMNINLLLKRIGILCLLVLLVIIIYWFRVELFGFKVCHSPDLLVIKKIEQVEQDSSYIITLEGDIISSALFYSGHKYTFENGVLKIGLAYTPIMRLSSGKSKFSEIIKLDEKVTKIILVNGKKSKIIFPMVQ